MKMQKPYYQDSAVTIFCGDCREVVPTLGRFDLLCIDPPYGIGRDRGMGGKGKSIAGVRIPRVYEGAWDGDRDVDGVAMALQCAGSAVVWGGNYYSDILPVMPKWLVWDKETTMPSYSDAELAWTNLHGIALEMKRYSGNGLLAKEKGRVHPTQKPLALMTWCIHVADKANGSPVQTILDCYAGSGTTGRAAKDLNRKCVLIEREERYCEIAAKRMRQEVFNFA